MAFMAASASLKAVEGGVAVLKRSTVGAIPRASFARCTEIKLEHSEREHESTQRKHETT